MHDEKNAAGRNIDISADDLLARLKQSYDEPTSGKPFDGVKASSKAEALKIDDEVYRDAKDTLHSSEAINGTDDSDLDVDELIDMYIVKPRAEREAQAKELESALEEKFVEADSAPEAEIEAEAEQSAPVEESADELGGLRAQVSEMENFGAADEVTEAPAVVDEADEAIDEAFLIDMDEIVDEDGLSDEDVLAECALLDGEDDDVKVADENMYEPSIEQYGDEDELDTRSTAVFDISRVKEMVAEDSSDELGRAIDEAFAESATEVFTPVSEADLEASDAEQVYGQADDEEVDQTDLHIMLAFGMEEQLKQTLGEEEASKLEEDIIQKHEETSQIQIVEQQLEYTTRDQNNEIMARYESRYKSLLIRMAAALALLVGVFLVENFSIFGLTLPAFMRPTSYPVVYAMIDLQLVVLSGVLVYRQLIDAYKSIREKKTTPETLTAVMLAVSLIYSLVAGFIAPVSGFAMYNLPVVFTVLASLIYEFMNLKREMYAFNVVASKKKKLVVTPVSDDTDSLEREVFSDFIPGEAQIVRVCKTDFVDGFFERCEGRKLSRPIIGLLIPIMLLVAIIFIVVGAIGGGAYGAFTSAFLSIAFTAPLTVFAIYSYPLYKASKDAFENESAILGDASVAEYSTSSIISFEDKEVFPSRGTKVTSIKVFGQNRIDEIIYNAASAFIKVDGPLADVFAQATQDIGYSENVELVEVDDDGFTVTVDEQVVYIGKASYMEKKDYEPPFDSETRRQEQAGATGILYLAFGGQLAAKLYVQYTIDGEFEKVLAQLYKTGMCVGIKSFDPNIDDMLLAKKIKALKYPVKVIRAKTVEDIPHTIERCESGVVSKRSVKALLRTVALCEKVSSVTKTCLMVGILAMIIGAIVMIFVSAFGATSMPSLYALLYQLFWLIPVVLISRFLV